MFYALLLETTGSTKKQHDIKVKEAKKCFAQRGSARASRASRGSLSRNPRAKGGGIKLSTTTKKTSKVRAGGVQVGSSTFDERVDRYKTATLHASAQGTKESANESFSIASLSELAFRTTRVWNSKTATADPDSWKTWTANSIRTELLKNISESNPRPYIDELDSVLDVLLSKMRINNEKILGLFRKASLLEQAMDTSSKKIDLYESCAEDWIVAHFIDKEIGSLPDSHVHLQGDTARLGVNTSIGYIHQAYKRTTFKRTQFQDHLEM